MADLRPYISRESYECSQCDQFKATGIPIETLEYFGWRLINGEWHCSYCTGNTTNLRRHMSEDDPLLDTL